MPPVSEQQPHPLRPDISSWLGPGLPDTQGQPRVLEGRGPGAQPAAPQAGVLRGAGGRAGTVGAQLCPAAQALTWDTYL